MSWVFVFIEFSTRLEWPPARWGAHLIPKIPSGAFFLWALFSLFAIFTLFARHFNYFKNQIHSDRYALRLPQIEQLVPTHLSQNQNFPQKECGCDAGGC